MTGRVGIPRVTRPNYLTSSCLSRSCHLDLPNLGDESWTKSCPKWIKQAPPAVYRRHRKRGTPPWGSNRNSAEISSSKNLCEIVLTCVTRAAHCTSYVIRSPSAAGPSRQDHSTAPGRGANWNAPSGCDAAVGSALLWHAPGLPRHGRGRQWRDGPLLPSRLSPPLQVRLVLGPPFLAHVLPGRLLHARPQYH